MEALNMSVYVAAIFSLEISGLMCFKIRLLMRRDSPLAAKEFITPEDLRDKPLIVSGQEARDGSLSFRENVPQAFQKFFRRFGKNLILFPYHVCGCIKLRLQRAKTKAAVPTGIDELIKTAAPQARQRKRR